MWTDSQLIEKFTPRQRLLYTSIVRRIFLNLRQLPKMSGYLLIRKVEGTTCNVCLDPYLQRSTDPDCSVCKGTGFIDAYFAGIRTTLFNRTPLTTVIRETPIGTVNQKKMAGVLVGIPLVKTYDIWVEDNDDRWRILEIKNMSELQGVPVVINAVMELIPQTDIIYTVDPITGE